MDDSKRIRRFKARLINELPFFPNNRETLLELEGQGLNGVLAHYLHWKTRLVYPRPRKIQISPEVTCDKRWKTLKVEIQSLLGLLRSGDDVTPYLSKRAHSHGYTPTQRVMDGEADSWEDKDQILNTKGFHHFHLSMNIENSGLSQRTDDVLFAYVTRDHFHAIGIFKHSVFNRPTADEGLNVERDRMWKLHDKHTTFGMQPGTVYLDRPITTSGHPPHIFDMSGYYAKLIRDIDVNLDDREYVNSMYSNTRFSPPSKFDFSWNIEGHDLCLLEKKTKNQFLVHQGYI